MKQDVFNQYADKIVDIFDITKEDLFSKSKKREIVDARHLLYYLCYKRPMTISYIQKYMSANGYDIQHSSIIHGINSVSSRVRDDADYMQIAKELDKAVFI
jgi:chromosomal replication initiation ATPase DnaA